MNFVIVTIIITVKIITVNKHSKPYCNLWSNNFEHHKTSFPCFQNYVNTMKTFCESSGEAEIATSIYQSFIYLPLSMKIVPSGKGT